MQVFQMKDNNLIKINDKDISLFNNDNVFAIVSPSELELINDIDKVASYTLRECKVNSHNLRIDHHPEYIYGILNVIEINNIKSESVNFNFFLTNNSLIIVNESENELLDRFVLKATNEEFIQVYEKITPQVLFLHLINDIIDTNEYYIDNIEENLEVLEERILDDAKKEYSKEIASKRRLVLQFKNRIESFPYLTKTLAENEYSLFNKQQLKTIHRLDYKATKMIDNITLLRDYLAQVRETFTAERDMKTNELMKIFTVVTSIFLPLTLIVGWYGMNFTTMPELTWKYGYTYVIILSITVIIGLIVFFKKKKLL